jgi:hypothetical protein
LFLLGHGAFLLSLSGDAEIHGLTPIHRLRFFPSASLRTGSPFGRQNGGRFYRYLKAAI